MAEPAYRAMWSAYLLANIGVWIQTVGAAWLMTTLTSDALPVALVQTATTLPTLLIGVPAGSLDIDHLVPLSNAFRSGAWAWDDTQRSRYANDLDDPEQLVAVELGANRSKGDSGPEEWQPPNPDTWCAYAQSWLRVKARWQLTVTPAELSILQDMLGLC